RGFDAIHGSDLEITLDGLPINEWSNVHAQGYLDLGLILPELIDHVVVTKGPYTLGQGAFAMAGSANYQLRVPSDVRGAHVAYTFGTTGRHRLFAGWTPSDGDGTQFIGVSATHDDGFGEQRSIDRANLNARVRVARFAKSAIDVTLLASAGRFDLPGTLRNDDVARAAKGFYDAYDPLARGTSVRALGALTYRREAGAHDLDVTAYAGWRDLGLLENFTGFLLNPVEGDRRDQRHRVWSFGAHGAHQWEVSDALAWRTGTGVRGDTLSQREDNVGRQLDALSTRRDLDATQLIAHALTGARWTPSKDVRVDAGARADLVYVAASDETNGLGAGALFTLSPRLTARWDVATQWSVIGAYGRGFRPPEARAFTAFDAGQEGVGEDLFAGEVATVTSDALELGGKWRPSEQLGVDVSGFATFIERESIFDHVSGTTLELNGTRRYGVEAVVTARPLRWLEIIADATYADARFLDSGNRVPFSPWLVSGVRALAGSDFGPRAGLRVLTVAPRPLPNGARGSTLILTDATAGWRWRRVRLDLEIENFLNRRLREGEYNYASNWRPGEPASQIPVLHTTAGPPLNVRATLGVLF
ncbi:MAG: TonB-dependent receptor, partial [Myxococcota bacterium]